MVGVGMDRCMIWTYEHAFAYQINYGGQGSWGGG
jgi:hypothetical protein